MVIYNIRIKTNSQIQPSTSYIDTIPIDGDQTILDYFKFLICKNDMAQWNTYTYNYKSLGYDYPITTKISSLFKDVTEPILYELSFVTPTNPFKRVYWILFLYEKDLFDIVNLDGQDPINQLSIGTWHGWGKLPHKIDKHLDNSPNHLVIIKHNNKKYAYNKHQLTKLIKTSLETLKLPHNDFIISTNLLKDQMCLFSDTLPIIDLD
jgi:hypothetical protein